MAKKLNATVTILNEIKVNERDSTRIAYELLIKVGNNEILPELRIAVLGNTNCGKLIHRKMRMLITDLSIF